MEHPTWFLYSEQGWDYNYSNDIVQWSVDLKHICQNLNQFGYGKGTKHGGLSEYTIIPARYAYLLKTPLEDAKAAILERKSGRIIVEAVLFSSIIICEHSNPVSWLSVGVDSIHGHQAWYMTESITL